ncbi:MULTISPECIES: cytochrome bc1 complex diheme cytochrome c subunit [Amycolatopsis]|uniref:Cytochrome bc1 complex cytochrome c subunit n=3 Tax=Amycolatopsis TaxID=1813 RepID=A0A076N257_AMYME|nr:MULTISPECIES: cytochrome c [Amycolatopsis]AIJ25216.1 ubiquinol-cytochrome C reductase cytochrome C subunit [Amycolatopsis methanolica 239]MCF6425839.1 cytochrome c [Amycolatopsis tucumanensis]ROS42886.1 menaquinol-cytochrome c reductase cytochrome c1 subunit precursor [Amycolatopsis thermoflava]
MTTSKNTSRRRFGARTKLRRRIAGALALGVALVGAGLGYALLVPQPQTAQAQDDPAQLRLGQQVYNNSCISCHGANLQGVEDRGPSLIGVGDAAVYFQTSSGRMPAVRQEAQAERKPAKLTPEEIDAVGAYIQANGGGPERPAESGEALRGDNPARGGELFRLNCASCHNFTGQGGALSAGKFAPELGPASEEQIYTAMLSGPQNMPKFSDRQLTPEEKRDIVAYVKSVSDGNNNPGGNGLGGLGPASEALVAWIVGIGAIVGVTLWIGSRA